MPADWVPRWGFIDDKYAAVPPQHLPQVPSQFGFMVYGARCPCGAPSCDNFNRRHPCPVPVWRPIEWTDINKLNKWNFVQIRDGTSEIKSSALSSQPQLHEIWAPSSCFWSDEMSHFPPHIELSGNSYLLNWSYVIKNDVILHLCSYEIRPKK